MARTGANSLPWSTKRKPEFTDNTLKGGGYGAGLVGARPRWTMDELLSEFLNETGEGLDQLDVELVRFEQEPNNAEMLNTIFRLVHTVKGTCGFLGLTRLAKLAHAAETLMGQYRDGAPVTVEGVSVILASIDRIKEILAGLERDGAEPLGSDADLIGRLQMLALGEPSGMAAERFCAVRRRRGSRNRMCRRCKLLSMSSSALGARRPGPTRSSRQKSLRITASARPRPNARETQRARKPCGSASIRSSI